MEMEARKNNIETLSIYSRKDTNVFYSLVLFASVMVWVYGTRPEMFFHEDGSLKSFGVGFEQKTMLPLWLFCFVAGIFSYILVMYARRFLG